MRRNTTKANDRYKGIEEPITFCGGFFHALVGRRFQLQGEFTMQTQHKPRFNELTEEEYRELMETFLVALAQISLVLEGARE